MDDVQHALLQLLKAVPGCTDSRQKLKAALSDVIPEKKREINLLVTAYDENIIERLNVTDATLFAFRMIKNLSDGYGLTRDAATWAVVSWCYILGKTEIANALEEIPSNSTAPASSHSVGQTHIIGIGTYKAGFDFKAGDIKLRHLTKDLQSPGMVKGICVLRGHSIECYKNTSSSSKGAKKIASFADSCHLEIEEGEYLILKVDTWADTDLIKIELTEYV